MALAAALAVACSDSSEVNYATVPGTYTARSFTTTDSGGTTTNWFNLGASLQLTLTATGGLTGQLFMPGADSGGGDINAAIAGTWNLVGDLVVFTDTADTFISHLPWIAGKNSLLGDYDVNGTHVRVQLTK